MLKVDLTSDGKWLLVVNYAANVKVYHNASNNFTLFQNIALYHGNDSAFGGAITDDHQWVVFGRTLGY